jgi:hypothetical protein
MKRVAILHVNSRIPNFFLHPVRRNRRDLRERGYDVRIETESSPRRLEADILCLSSKYFSTWWTDPKRVFAFVDQARDHASKIVWLDDSDSTGVTHFELLPHIDLYLKKQLLKDRTLYAKPLYGDRIFTDYYHRALGITDAKPFQSKPLDMSQAHKVHLSWHIGLGDMTGDILPRPVKWLRSKLPPKYPTTLPGLDGPRPIDVMFRGSRKYDRETVSYHRERIGEVLDGMSGLNMVLAGFVSIRQYIRETEQSKIVVSPFGWGEIGVRDFQAWMYGAVLMKPDMSHMETWPDVFRSHETYYPLDWSLKNLESDIRELLADEPHKRALAVAGRNAYMDMVSTKGMEAFCDWFVDRMGKA